jgi:hypothetical protein
MELKPCRDCGTAVPWTSRSCPHCGILNPVAKWVALPDGADETYREPVRRVVETPAPAYGAAAVAAPGAPAAYAQLYPQAFAPAGVHAGGPARAEVPAGAADPLAKARKRVKECAGVFYVVAVLNLVASYFLGPLGVVVAVTLAGLATWLWKSRSQMAAIGLLLFSLLNIFFVVKYSQTPAGWPAFIMVLAAWRGLNATMELRDAGV